MKQRRHSKPARDQVLEGVKDSRLVFGKKS